MSSTSYPDNAVVLYLLWLWWVLQGNLRLGLRHNILNRKHVLQPGSLGFERSGHLGGKGGLMRGAIQLNYGKWRINVA